MSGTLLVTGGGGFVGSHTASHFASKGWEIVVFDNLSRSELLGETHSPLPRTYHWDRLGRQDGISLVKGDVRRFADIEAAAREVDAIVHAAAQVAVTTSLEDPRADFEANVLGTLNVLEAARKSRSDPRILFCSTNKVYGSNVNRIPVRENGNRYEFADPEFTRGIPPDFPIDACEHTPYGVSKLAADLYVQDYAHTYGLKTVIPRMSCIYGERQAGNEDQGWVAHFVLSILRGRPLTIYGDGKQVRDVLYIGDLVRLFHAALASQQALRGNILNVGGGPQNTLSLLELISLVEEISGRKADITFSDWRLGDQRVYVSDIAEASALFGWSPSVSPREGVSRLVHWYTSEFLS